jgi:hypothetical protein
MLQFEKGQLVLEKKGKKKVGDALKDVVAPTD